MIASAVLKNSEDKIRSGDAQVLLEKHARARGEAGRHGGQCPALQTWQVRLRRQHPQRGEARGGQLETNLQTAAVHFLCCLSVAWMIYV